MIAHKAHLSCWRWSFARLYAAGSLGSTEQLSMGSYVYLCAQTAAKELAAINAQYPFTPLKWLPETLRLTFAEGIQMLKDAGHEVWGRTQDSNTSGKTRHDQFAV